MDKWISGAIVMAVLGLFPLSGCDNAGDEQVGGPGADVRTDDDTEPQKEEATFTVSLEEEEIEAPLGEKKELTISIDRGEEFEQTVTAEIKAPEGLTVTPKTVQYQAGQEEAKVFLEAGPGAEVGRELAVEITFKPETGQSITKQLLVTLVEGEKQDEAPAEGDKTVEEGEAPAENP
ncbi:MAG: hypothetical protein KY475_09045 [Planctomycetes bacterium]|nr:hypothetical protein [Planctomycetota bacterium]